MTLPLRVPLFSLTVSRDHVTQEVCAVLRIAFQCLVVGIDHTEAFRISFCPLIVVDEGPDEISPEIHTGFDGIGSCLKVLMDVIDSLPVMDSSVESQDICFRTAVFGDVQRLMACVFIEPLKLSYET